MSYNDTEKANGQDWILTYTGRRISFSSPDYENIHIDDIVIPLSRICRSNGHTKFVYTVLDHLILSTYLAIQDKVDKKILLAIILHDAHESYCCDLPSPLKTTLTRYKKIENKLQKAIFKHFNVPYPTKSEWEIVKKYDTLAFKCESKVLFEDDSFINDKDDVLPDVTIKQENPARSIELYKESLLHLLHINGIEYKDVE